MSNYNLWRKIAAGLTRIFVGLLMIAISAYAVVNAQRANIDGFLGTQSWTVVTDPTGDDNLYNYEAKKGKVIGIDGKEIDVDCSNLKGLFAYQKDVSMRLAAEGAVLLENKNKALPLVTEDDRNVTLLGLRSYSKIVEGTMWGMVSYKCYGTQFGGLMGSVAPGQLAVPIDDALRANGFKVNETVETLYEDWLADEKHYPDNVFSKNYKVNEATPAEVGVDAAAEATFGKTAIVTVGRPAKEQGYYLPGAAGKADPDEFDADKDVLGLCKDELATLAYAREHFDKVIVLINAVAMDLPELSEYADAVMWVGLPGVYGFEGIARVLNGTLSPSGRTVDTFAAQSANALAMVNQQYQFKSGNGITIDQKKYTNANYVPEVESIYTGYKYYESRYYDSVLGKRDARDKIGATGGAETWNYKNEVVWSFGEGYSYTDFEETFVDNVKVDPANLTVTATIKVKNTGDTYAGKHVVELYVQTPYNETGIEKSAVQLVGFAKTPVIKPGNEATVTVTADLQDFASWDDEYQHHAVKGAYVLEEGDYYFSLGYGAHDALNNILAKQGHTVAGSDGYMTKDGNAALVKQERIGRINITESKAGVVLQNQLDSMDLEKLLPGQVKNFSRASWKNNWPKEYKDLTPAASQKDALHNKIYTLSENGNPSSVKFGRDNGLSYGDLKPDKGQKLDYDDPILKMYVEQYDLDDAVVALMNGDSYSAGATTVAGVKKAQPFFILDDGPMGFDSYTAAKGVGRVPEKFDASKDPDYETYKDTPMRTLPTGCVVGATWNTELCEEAGEMLGNLSLWNGVNGIQGPGSNMHRNVYNARNHEYYSEDGLHCGLMMSAYCGGCWNYGLCATVKHFAFNDTEINRMGVGAYMSEQRARENELRAFQIGIERKRVVGMMAGMNRAGAYFVGGHPGLTKGIIRGEWDFTGLYETDMTKGTYDNGRDFIAMGGDSMLQSVHSRKDSSTDELLASFEGDVQYATGEVTEAVKKDTQFLSAVQDALMHMTWVMANSNYLNGKNSTSRLEKVNTWYDNVFIALFVVSGVIVAAGIAGYVVLTIKKKDEIKD